jgi:hypothetical protein
MIKFDFGEEDSSTRKKQTFESFFTTDKITDCQSVSIKFYLKRLILN